MFKWFKNQQKLIQENKELKEQQSYYSNRLDDVLETINNIQNKVYDAEERVRQMVKYRELENVENLSKEVTIRLNDLLVRPWMTVYERTKAIELEIARVLKLALTGSSDGKVTGPTPETTEVVPPTG